MHSKLSSVQKPQKTIKLSAKAIHIIRQTSTNLRAHESMSKSNIEYYTSLSTNLFNSLMRGTQVSSQTRIGGKRESTENKDNPSTILAYKASAALETKAFVSKSNIRFYQKDYLPYTSRRLRKNGIRFYRKKFLDENATTKETTKAAL